MSDNHHYLLHHDITVIRFRSWSLCINKNIKKRTILLSDRFCPLLPKKSHKEDKQDIEIFRKKYSEGNKYFQSCINAVFNNKYMEVIEVMDECIINLTN